MQMGLLHILLLAASTMFTGAASADTAPLLPPLEIPPVLTSSFGEYRSGHYHGGSTTPPEGARASRAGSRHGLRPARARVGVGYGRAVYFRLADGGSPSSPISPPSTPHRGAGAGRAGPARPLRGGLRAPARRARFRRGRDPGPHRIERRGPAHLHAELRTGPETSVALNPLGTGWDAPDAAPPGSPRARGARRSGARWREGRVRSFSTRDARPRSLPFSSRDRRACGWKRGRRRRGGHRSLRIAWSGGSTTAGLRGGVRAHGLAMAAEVEWTFHNALARSEGERWVCLTPAPRSRQPVARWLSSPAPLPGLHRWTFRVFDRAGNLASAEISVRVELPRPGAGGRGGAPGFRSRGEVLEWRVPRPSASAPEALRAISPRGTLHVLRGVPEETASALVELAAPPGKIEGSGASRVRTARTRSRPCGGTPCRGRSWPGRRAPTSSWTGRPCTIRPGSRCGGEPSRRPGTRSFP